MRLLFILLLVSFFATAQRDSAFAVSLAGVHLGGHLPAGDMVKRFGADLNLGGSYLYKTRSNWIFGLESNYFFGQNVKEDVTRQLKNAEGFITDNEGYPADLRINERGFGTHIVLGKVFKFFSPNPNSGLMVSIGGGYLQHKVNLYDANQRIAAVKGDLKHGYDRLSGGLSLTQFIGYLYLSENRISNFYFGFESYQAFTKSFRKLNYDSGLPDTGERLDILHGFRLGWILPLYRKKPDEFYYY
jgi:hypothetical protein